MQRSVSETREEACTISGSGNIDDDGGHDGMSQEGKARSTQTRTYGSPMLKPGAYRYGNKPGPGID